MGKIRQHPPVKFFSAVTYNPSCHLEIILKDLEKFQSSIELISESYDFSAFTQYYSREMGDSLHKVFVAFSELSAAEQLVSLKLSTNQLENKYSKNDKRNINIDPGYISQAKLVLATTKNYSHRIYLGRGIFADLHLLYQNGTFTPRPWTYPDYKSKSNVSFFNAVRKVYLEQLGEKYLHETREDLSID